MFNDKSSFKLLYEMCFSEQILPPNTYDSRGHSCDIIDKYLQCANKYITHSNTPAYEAFCGKYRAKDEDSSLADSVADLLALNKIKDINVNQDLFYFIRNFHPKNKL